MSCDEPQTRKMHHELRWRFLACFVIATPASPNAYNYKRHSNSIVIKSYGNQNE